MSVGVAAGAASVLLFLDVFGWDTPSGSHASLRINPTPGGAWVGIEGRF